MSDVHSDKGPSRRFLGTPILRFILGSILIVAGTLKIADPKGFLTGIGSFGMFSESLAYIIALSLPWLEFWTGLALVSKRADGGALIVTLFLMSAFIALLALSWARGVDITCGCFGTLLPADSSYRYLLGRNLLILIAAGLLSARKYCSDS